MINLNYQMNHILSQIIQDHFKNIDKIDNPSIRIYANKVEHRITFEIKISYHLKVLTPEPMKLLGSAENKITKETNGENIS